MDRLFIIFSNRYLNLNVVSINIKYDDTVGINNYDVIFKNMYSESLECNLYVKF